MLIKNKTPLATNRPSLDYMMREEECERKKSILSAHKLILEINKLRSQPSAYARDLESQLNRFEGKVLILENGFKIQTQEGKKAVIECIEYLNKKSPIKALHYEKQLNRIAVKKNRNTKLDLAAYFKKFTDFRGKTKYIQNFGINDVRLIMRALLVADGDQTRLSRQIFFSQEFNYVGGFIKKEGENGCGLLFVENKQSNTKDFIKTLSTNKILHNLKEPVSNKQSILQRIKRSLSQSIKNLEYTPKQLNKKPSRNLLPKIERNTQKQYYSRTMQQIL